MSRNKKYGKKVIKQALFIISSPFQAICAFEAISKFQIEFYDFVVLLTPNDNRREQIYFFLDSNHIKYNVLFFDRISIRRFGKIYCLIRKKINKKYNLLFCGDYFDLTHLFLSIILSKFYSKIVFIDDGASSINALSGQYMYGYWYGFKRVILNMFLNIKMISHNTYFTIYDKIETTKFDIISNELSQFRNNLVASDSVVACVVGTNIEEYCVFYNLSESQYLSFFKELLIDLKNKYEKVIYSPHGRCKNISTLGICHEFNIEVRYSRVSVEVDYLYDRIYPKLIVAFDSTALYTLKTIFGDSDFVNYQLLVRGVGFNEFAQKSAAYLHDNFGIETRRRFVDC